MASEATDRPPASLLLATLTSPILLTGGYAWTITMGPASALALHQSIETGLALRPLLSVGASLLALAALIAGVALERRRSPLAPLVGIWLFLAALLLAWLISPAAIDIARLDSVRGALGAGGLALYSLAWGVPDVLRRLVPEDDPRADTTASLDARDQLPGGARFVAALGVLTAAILSFFAWKVRDVPRALFGHALSALASVLLISAAAEIAVGRKGYVASSPSSRLRRASSALLLLGLLVALGGAFSLMTR